MEHMDDDLLTSFTSQTLSQIPDSHSHNQGSLIDRSKGGEFDNDPHVKISVLVVIFSRNMIHVSFNWNL